jgi:hypothetical protein
LAQLKSFLLCMRAQVKSKHLSFMWTIHWYTHQKPPFKELLQCGSKSLLICSAHRILPHQTSFFLDISNKRSPVKNSCLQTTWFTWEERNLTIS